MPKMGKIHVTYDETKRVVSHQKGGDVQGLRHTFLQVFSDVLSSEIAPAHVTFQRYDDKFEDYVELQNDERIEDDIKIRALVSKQVKQTARNSPSEAESETKPQYWPHCHFLIPLWSSYISESAGSGASPFTRPHLIKKNTTYRLWNPVSRQNDSFIQRDPNTNFVNCSGLNSGINTVMTAIDETRQRTFYVALTFEDKVAQKDYAMTGNGKGQEISTLENKHVGALGDKSVFEPMYYWSYTMFRNKFYNTLYLGCDNTGKTTLVENVDLDYPNPQALFILNKITLIGDEDEQ